MKRIVVIALAVFAAFGSTAAMAAWGPAGSGSGTSSGLSLGLPTSVAANPLTSSSVRVTWSPPGSGPTPSQYVVRRTAPAAATVCTVAPPTAQCDDTGLTASTTYSYTIEARLGTNWTSGQTSAVSTTTPPGPTFFLTIAGGTTTAGTAFNVTITATTNGLTTDAAYVGVKTITFSGPANSPGSNAPVYPATVTFAAGIGTANATLFNAVAASLQATDGTRTGSVSITVVAGAASQLKYTSSAPSCASGTVNVGNGGTFTSKVTAYDAYLNPDPGARTVNLSRNPVQGVLAPTSLTIAAANSETTNSFGLKIPSGNPTATVVTASSGALTTATCSVNR